MSRQSHEMDYKIIDYDMQGLPFLPWLITSSSSGSGRSECSTSVVTAG